MSKKDVIKSALYLGISNFGVIQVKEKNIFIFGSPKKINGWIYVYKSI